MNKQKQGQCWGGAQAKTGHKAFFSPLICPHLFDFFQLFIILQEES